MSYCTADYKLIYIFAIPDEAHKGLLKIGEATIHTTKTYDALPENCPDLLNAAEKGRIKDYTFTAGIKVNMLWAQLAVRVGTNVYKGNQIAVLGAFRDHDVHNVLKNSGIKVSYPNGIKAREWYECDLQTAKNAIKAVIDNRQFLGESEKSVKEEPKIVLRDEQQEAVNKTLTAYNRYDKMLWHAKMRFGKTVTAYELIRSGAYQKTIVVTHRPVVEHGWADDHRKIFGADSTHIFMRKQNLVYSDDYFDASSDIKNDVSLRNAKERGDYFTYFASMQDLRGSVRAGGKFNKNNAVFDMDWDLVIYDEAHEGTQTELGQRVQELLETPKNGKTPKVLELSGTPYNILEKYDDNVFVWDYVMEQEAKQEWAYKHPGEPNPYEDMPRMNIFTFDMSKALSASYRYETESSAFNFREFFRVYTGDPEKDYGHIPQGFKVGDFVHLDDVKEFLDIISTDSPDTKYPFATYEYRSQFKHTFWIVPGVAAARALSALLQKHPVFSHYRVVNVAGEGDVEMPYDDAYEAVSQAIAENPYTITLSCGKLTTGVTVREWTAVMMLTGSATTDAKGYMQTIFRVQSAGCIEGRQKENCYVFDFAPDRSLRVVSEAHQLSGKGQQSDEKYRELLGKFLNYCPIYAVEGVRMREYNVATLMRQIKRLSLDKAIKSGFEDDSIYKVDAGMVMDERDYEFFKALQSRLSAHKKSNVDKKIKIAENGMDQAEYERAKKVERKPKKELTPEEKALLEKLKEQRKQRKNFLALLRNISIRLPLLIFGADVPLTENIRMEDFVNIVDDESWKEFLPNDVTKDLFQRSIKYFDEDVLIGAGLRIRRLVKQADEYPPTERIRRITELFNHFRNPDKETVLTPWRVVNMHMSDCLGGYCFLNENFDVKEPLDEPRFVDRGQVTADLFKTDGAKILEINSKSGLYPLYAAYSIYRHLLPKKESEMPISELYAIWDKVLEKNIFVLCKTNMARDITRRTLTGFTKATVNTHYQGHLLERMKSDMDWVVKKLQNPAVWGKEGTSMKFDAVVGNPPYQEIVKNATVGNNNITVDIYGYFRDLSLKIADIVSLIYPAKDLQRGDATLMDHNLVKVRIYNGSDNEQEKNIPGEPSVFGSAVRRIPGDVGVYLWNLKNPTKTIIYQGCEIERTDKIMPVRKEFFSLAKKLEKCIGPDKDYSIRKCCESNFVENHPGSVLSEVADRTIEPPAGYTKVITNNVSGSGGKARWYYIKTKDLDYIQPKVYKVVISSAFPNEAFKNPHNVDILSKNEMFGRTKLCMYYSDTESDAVGFKKYLNTKFIKAIANMTPYKFMYYMPNFDTIKFDIDWGKPISEIDKQLYAKYNLSPDEIFFIETMIKPME